MIAPVPVHLPTSRRLLVEGGQEAVFSLQPAQLLLVRLKHLLVRPLNGLEARSPPLSTPPPQLEDQQRALWPHPVVHSPSVDRQRSLRPSLRHSRSQTAPDYGFRRRRCET